MKKRKKTCDLMSLFSGNVGLNDGSPKNMPALPGIKPATLACEAHPSLLAYPLPVVQIEEQMRCKSTTDLFITVI